MHAFCHLWLNRLMVLGVLVLTGCHGLPSDRGDVLFGGFSSPGRHMPEESQMRPVYGHRVPAALTNLGATEPAERVEPLDRSLPSAPAVSLESPQSVTQRGAQPSDGRPDYRPVQTPVAATNPGWGYNLDTANYEQLQAMLQQRGVNWQQLRWIEGDTWEFHCAVPESQNHVYQRNIRIRATGNYGLTAVRAAIRRIDQPAE